MTLRDYLNKIEQLYKSYAADYVREANAVKAARDGIAKTSSNRNLTEAGKSAQIAALHEAIDQHKAKMAQLSEEARGKAMDVRKQVEKAFYSRYHADAIALDANALELLKSGIMSDDELKHMADQYQNNNTMLRLIGKQMEESTTPATQRLGRAIQALSDDPHLKAVDSMIYVGTSCMGGAPLSGSDGAEHMLNHFDEMAAPVYAGAPDIAE